MKTHIRIVLDSGIEHLVPIQHVFCVKEGDDITIFTDFFQLTKEQVSQEVARRIYGDAAEENPSALALG